jgi:hypothetical protein
VTLCCISHSPCLPICRTKQEKQVPLFYVRSLGSSMRDLLFALIFSVLRSSLGSFSLAQQRLRAEGDWKADTTALRTWQQKPRLLLIPTSSEAMRSKPSITPGWFNQLPVQLRLELLWYCTNTVITMPACDEIAL